jgi:hypothetical protein
MSSKPPKAQPAGELLTLEADAQRVLDELWAEKLIPFALNVGKITKDIDENTIHFYDSRMRNAFVPLTEGHSFKDLVRKTVLDVVAKMSGPLTRKDRN